MTKAGFEDEVRVLREHMSGVWEGAETDGRDEMAAILSSKLGYNKQRANEMIDALIEARVLRYQRGSNTGDASEDAATPNVIPAVPVGAGTGGGGALTGVPIVPLGLGMGGHWKIGHDSDNDPTILDAPGRRGQVDPDTI